MLSQAAKNLSHKFPITFLSRGKFGIIANILRCVIRCTVVQQFYQHHCCYTSLRIVYQHGFISEMNRFLSADVNENETAMDFWRQKSTDFPILSQMAKIYLAISPGNVPVESMFSTAGYMLNSRRSSMAPYKADMVLFLHDNYDVVS